MDRESQCLVIRLVLIVSVTVCFGLAPVPTNVEISCLNFNCTLFWDEPDNTTGSVIMYTVEEEIINENDVTNLTFVEIPDCVNVQHTKCNLVSIIEVDFLSNVIFVVVSAFVNGERSERIEVSFIPWFKATLSHPDVDLVPPVQPTSFTVHIHAPLSPFVDLKSGELLRVDELPAFKKSGFFTPKFMHSSVLSKMYPNNTVEEKTKESEYNLDKVLVFEDLTPATTYRFEVTSSVVRGRLVKSTSKESALITVTTLEDEPSEGPVITDIVRKNPNCSSPDVSPVILSWKPPPDNTHNGVITHYSIRYMYPGYDFSLATVKNCSIKDNTLELELQRWQAYEFAVFICNSVGCAESDHKTLFNLQALRKGSRCTNVSVDLAPDHPLIISWQPPGNFTECITQYLVGIHFGERPTKKPVIKEMIFTTFMQINETLPPGTYTVIVQSFIRNGFDSVTAGEEARKQFMIEDKTVTNHLVLPLVIGFSFLFSAILVAVVICCKWILRPFDFHLEKTRALKIAREYQEPSVHYHNTEHEVYDALPGGSRRSSRTSIVSFLPIRNSRIFLRTDSTSSVGNRLASHREPPSRLTSHIEEPDEEDHLIESVMYSPISTRRNNILECSDTQPSVFPEMRPLLSSGGSGFSIGRQFPMLTIEIGRDSDSERVVRWKAGGYDGTDDDDPFDLPKAEDYDDACASGNEASKCPPSTEKDARTSSSSDKSSIHSQRNSGIKYSNLPLLNSSSGSSASEKRLHYASLASQTSELSLSSSLNSQRELNYAQLASQNSESSEAGSAHVINVINPSLFAAVDEEDDNQDPEGEQYSRLGNNQSSNLSANTPNPGANTDGYIDAYSRMSSSQPAQNGQGAQLASPETGRDGDEGYHQLARAVSASSDRESNDAEYHQLGRRDPQGLPQVREDRTDSSASQSYVQLSSSNSATLSQAVTNRPDTRSDVNADSNILAEATRSQCSDKESDNSGDMCSPQEKPEPESNTHPRPTNLCKTASSDKQNPDDTNGAIDNMQTDLPQYVNMSNQGAASPHFPRNVGANTQLQRHSPCASPAQSRTRANSAERGHLYRSVRVPPMQLTPGSPLLPSRALDICNSDSEDSSTNYNSHESLDSVGETRASVSAQSTHHDNQLDTTQNGATLVPKRNLSCQSESSAADENSIPEMCVHVMTTSDNEIQEVNDNCDGSVEDDGIKTEVTAPPSEVLTNGGYVMRT